MSLSEGNLQACLPWQYTQWRRVVNLHRDSRLPHAVLLTGLPGIGKNRFSLALAQYLMCASPEAEVACGKCRQCVFNLAGTHPDLKILEPEERGKQIKVDRIRGLVEFLSQTSLQGGYKIALISPAENMNINAANALLKSLEEPSAKTLLLLVTDSPSRLLPTIRSRCQSIKFSIPTETESVQWLTKLVPAQIDVRELLEESGGQPMTALNMLETDELSLRQQMSDEFLAMLSGAETPLTIAEKWLQHDLVNALEWLSRKLMTIVSHQMTAKSTDDRWQAFASSANIQQLFKLFDKVVLLLDQLNRGANPNKQLALEELMLTACESFAKTSR
ncbi:MAG: DNA polymerase-3 subunit delta' [Gammaproteobacteria bacterium]|jgi:DNA polymerase-3 subunit delta'